MATDLDKLIALLPIPGLGEKAAMKVVENKDYSNSNEPELDAFLDYVFYRTFAYLIVPFASIGAYEGFCALCNNIKYFLK